MIVFPNCKINLGLHITGKRSDGYHNLETVFFPVKWYDVLEIVRSENKGTGNKTLLSSSGIIATGQEEDNICLKAHSALKRAFPQKIPSLEFYLHKTIPPGAGLGGGSADAASTLILLNRQFNLGLTTEQLSGYAADLGSDCPFFIINKPCFATGRGEMLEPIEIDLLSYKILLVNPRIQVNTREAFSHLVAKPPVKSIKKIIRQPVSTWKQELINDFEDSVFAKFPEIGNIKTALYQGGAAFASMSGSGSTVYGIFDQDKAISINFPSHYITKESGG